MKGGRPMAMTVGDPQYQANPVPGSSSDELVDIVIANSGGDSDGEYALRSHVRTSPGSGKVVLVIIGLILGWGVVFPLLAGIGFWLFKLLGG